MASPRSRRPRGRRSSTRTRETDNDRARVEFVDVASGERVRPGPPGAEDGAAPTGRLVADVEGVEVEVEPEDVLAVEGDHPRTQRFDYATDLTDYPGRAEDRRAELEAEAQRKAARAPRFRETFDSPREAAKLFYDENASFFDHISDPIDGVRDWMDGIEVRVGRAHRKLNKTRRGQEILNPPGPGRYSEADMLQNAIAYVFGQARGRRWDAIDWDAIDNLEESVAPYLEPIEGEAYAGGLYWRPIFGRPTLEQFEDLSGEERLAVLEQESAAEVRDALEQLRESYAQNAHCFSAESREVIERRIAQWDEWRENPQRIPTFACEPDPETAGYTCNYPAVAGELREIAAACDAGYDPGWAEPAARGGVAGFPDLTRAPADPRPEVLDALEPGDELRQLFEGGRAFGGPAAAIVDVRALEGTWYQLEWVKCGTRSCHCFIEYPLGGHGPYWYEYWVEGGRRRSGYIGKKFRERVA